MKTLKQFLTPGRLKLMTLFSLIALPASAQSTNGTFWSQEMIFYTMVGLVFAVALLVLLVSIYVLQLLKAFVRNDMTEEQLAAYEAEPSFWAKLWQKWNDFKPIEKEGEILLDHDYDGIRELDNHLPPWWKGLFYVTIVYAVIYLLVFHVFETAPLQEEQYEIEMARAEEAALQRQGDQTYDFDETTVTFSDDPGDLGAGKKIYDSQCAPCHKVDGGGSVGPNLTDDYWLHGGSMKDIYSTVKFGVPDKGMISWESLLNPEKMRQVSSYIMTLRGTNPPGAKAAQGDLFVPEEVPSDTTSVNND